MIIDNRDTRKEPIEPELEEKAQKARYDGGFHVKSEKPHGPSENKRSSHQTFKCG